MVLFVFQLHPVCNFGKFINFTLGNDRSERVKQPFVEATATSMTEIDWGIVSVFPAKLLATAGLSLCACGF